MINKNKTIAHLKSELQELHLRLFHLEATENECQQTIEEIHQNYQIQNVLNKLLHISLEQISIGAMLEQFIEEITSLSWLALESKGAIFLAGEYAEVLEMKAYRSLNKHLLTMCARVPFGKCLCGRAASFGEILFTDSSHFVEIRIRCKNDKRQIYSKIIRPDSISLDKTNLRYLDFRIFKNTKSPTLHDGSIPHFYLSVFLLQKRYYILAIRVNTCK